MSLVPGGDFEMGDHHLVGDPNELPVHAVYISPFYLDVYKTTNEEYCEYLNSAFSQGLIEVIGGEVFKFGGSEKYCDTTTSAPWHRINWNGSVFSVTAGKEDHPMWMSWYGAVAYSNWRSVEDALDVCYDLDTWECNPLIRGYRLPTEAEWEKAARGGERNPYYKYSWGNDIDGSKANYANSGDPFEGNPPDTTPVDYYDGSQIPTGADMVNGYGLYDMGGNVNEHCNDWYDYYYYSSSVYRNPRGPVSGIWRVMRGGCWYDSTRKLRCASRGTGSEHAYVGIRLALSKSVRNMSFVQAGEFDMGDHQGVGEPDELPVHTVNLDAFWLDRYEVTTKNYCKYLNSSYDQGLIFVVGDIVYGTGNSRKYCEVNNNNSRILYNNGLFSVAARKQRHPMVMVTWYGAAAYANWLSLETGLRACYDLNTWECTFGAGGFRLPTEAEWEKAARGGEQNPYFKYPWGNSIDGSCCNYWGSGDFYESELIETTPVGYYDGNQTPPGVDMANGYGLYDVAGNVFEWCNDWYSDTYYGSSSYENPQGPTSGAYRVLRGGAWDTSTDFVRCAYRRSHPPEMAEIHLGFRLVLD